jgi:kinesin family protein 5
MADARQSQFEAKYTAQEEMLHGEIASLTERAESRAAEIRRLQSTVESYKLSNEELNVSHVLRCRVDVF